jgi:hypothetical protein
LKDEAIKEYSHGHPRFYAKPNDDERNAEASYVNVHV